MPTVIDMGQVKGRIDKSLITTLQRQNTADLSGDLLALGKKLYQLFFGAVGWTSADNPLPIQLLFSHRRHQDIFPFPYELIADSSGAQICRQQGRMIRILDQDISPCLLTLPIRVLLIIAPPHSVGYAHIHAEKHQQAIREEWAYFDKLVNFDTITGPNTVGQLRQHLTMNKPYHVVHIVAHGSDNHQGSGGAVIFADENGEAVSYDGNSLYAELTYAGQVPHLVILNSCLTGGGQTAQANQFAVVAWQLLVSGIPAVVAMQAKVEETFAAAAGARFYHSLLAGHSLDEAVQRMRTSLGNKWYAPVLAIHNGYDCRFFTAETQAFLRYLHTLNGQIKPLYKAWEQNKTLQQYLTLLGYLRNNPSECLPLIHHHDELAAMILSHIAEQLNVLT